MSDQVWDPHWEAKHGSPTPIHYLTNLRAQPIEGGVLELLIADHPRHAAAIQTLEDYAIDREVVLVLDSREYHYMCMVGEDGKFYLTPMDGFNDELPDPQRFLEKAFHLRMRH